jgi:hypothetical protein
LIKAMTTALLALGFSVLHLTAAVGQDTLAQDRFPGEPHPRWYFDALAAMRREGLGLHLPPRESLVSAAAAAWSDLSAHAGRLDPHKTTATPEQLAQWKRHVAPLSIMIDNLRPQLRAGGYDPNRMLAVLATLERSLDHEIDRQSLPALERWDKWIREIEALSLLRSPIGQPITRGRTRPLSRYEVAVTADVIWGQAQQWSRWPPNDPLLWMAYLPLVREMISLLANELEELSRAHKQMLADLVAAEEALFLQSRAAPFDDVPRDHWAADAVDRLKWAGILRGYPSGGFNR